MKNNPFTWAFYKGKPAVYDKIACVYYFGYKTIEDAMKKAEELNKGA